MKDDSLEYIKSGKYSRDIFIDFVRRIREQALETIREISTTIKSIERARETTEDMYTTIRNIEALRKNITDRRYSIVYYLNEICRKKRGYDSDMRKIKKTAGNADELNAEVRHHFEDALEKIRDCLVEINMTYDITKAEDFMEDYSYADLDFIERERQKN